MQEFLHFVLRQLVEYPEDILLTKFEAPRKVVFKLRLRKSDIGKVVGKHGQTLTAIRSLLADWDHSTPSASPGVSTSRRVPGS